MINERLAGPAFIFVMVVAIVLFHLPSCEKCAAGEEPSSYEEWEKAAQQAGAGEEVGVPPEEGVSAHDSWCEKKKGWCPTVVNGVVAGKTWCLGKPGAKKKPDCYYSHRNRSYDIYLALKAWYDELSNGRHGLFSAGHIRTESEFVWDAKTKSTTGECGIASVDTGKAKLYDVNACDRKASLWASQAMFAKRLLQLRERYPQLELAPLSDQWKLAGAGGAIGSNKVMNLIDASGALRLKDDGTLFYAHPHDRVLKWLQWKDKSDPSFFYNYFAANLLGLNPGLGAFRTARSVGQEGVFEDMFVPGLEWAYGEPVVPPRPDDIMPFPGTAQHCQCWRWPELEDKLPPPATSDPNINDPRKEES